jgi:transcriptional regulator with GAF, ATPase, and Fis domain
VKPAPDEHPVRTGKPPPLPAERGLFLHTLTLTEGDKAAAARLLGLSVRQLERKARSYKLR